MSYSFFLKSAFVGFFALLYALPGCTQRHPDTENIDVQQVRKLQIAQLAITQLYVDTVNQKKLVENAINGMLSKLDPHSAYSDPEETRKMNEPLEGNFEGIGVQFNMLEDTLVVIQTVAKGPSEKVGILNGDRIVSVDGRAIAGVKMDRDSIMKQLRGPKGTKVKVGIVRRGVKEVLYFTIIRDKIPMNTLDAAYMISPGVGYIRLDRFGATSGQEVKEGIARLRKQGMQDLIFDLESNGGGYLGAAVEIASQYLKEGDAHNPNKCSMLLAKDCFAKDGLSFLSMNSVLLQQRLWPEQYKITIARLSLDGVLSGKGLCSVPLIFPMVQ